MKQVYIVDIRLSTYIYHSTPAPNSLACLIAGYHKAQGDSVLLSHAPMKGDNVINYIVADDRYGELVIEEQMFKYPNTFGVGRSFGADSYYNTEWENYPPDLSIYSSFHRNWLSKYPKYNPIRLRRFLKQPFLVKRQGKYFAPPSDVLILDMVDKELLEFIAETECNELDFLNPPEISDTETFELFLALYKNGVIRGGDCKVELEWEIVKDPIVTAELQRLWAEYKCGRMVVLRLRADVQSFTTQDIIDIYNWIGDWRMKYGKRIGLYPANIENNYRLWTEFKRWTNGRAGYAKNSLVDYIIYDGCRDISDIAGFLADPYTYLNRGRMGANKLGFIVDLFESGEIALINTLTTSYPRGGY